jgi:hypothetical protein
MDDPADLDGDGEFDAIDISIMENSEDSGGRKNNSGCCVLFFLLGSMLIAGLRLVDYLI